MIGIDKIRQYLGEYKGNYIIIGGTACNLNLEEANLQGRATKDVDMIMVCEALTPEYLRSFWGFIRAGGYSAWQVKSEEEVHRCFYRFIDPKDSSFPKYIELFSRKPDAIKLPENAHLVHIPVSEYLSSFSAILMDDAYYGYAVSHTVELDGVQAINHDALIVLKIKAYLNNVARKEAGHRVQSDDIDKHKRDVFRMVYLLTPEDHFEAPESIRQDINRFLTAIKRDPINTKAISKNMGVPEITQEQFVEIIRTVYTL